MRSSLLIGCVAAALSSITSAAAAQVADSDQHDHAPASGAPREASGTGWLPAGVDVPGLATRASGWDLMLHGRAYAQFLLETGSPHHSARQAGSINWVMAMAARSVAGGRLTARAMFSGEPWTIAGCGYPNTLATGEVCDGDSIHDRQHPHDLFMELAALYERPLGGGVSMQLYAAPAGEPALGPVAFPHRPSAAVNPVAPIAHHWLDSTHVSFGVVTAGVLGRRWKAEVSAFNGREPDDRRAGLDLAALDSRAARVSFAPNDRLVLQVSGGRMREAEAGVGSQPRADVTRVTASATYHRAFCTTALDVTAAWGVNREREQVPGAWLRQTTHAGVVEASARWRVHTAFLRAEVAGKSAHDLHAHEFIEEIFTVGKVQVGYHRELGMWGRLTPGVGGTVSLAVVPPILAPRYEGRIAPGVGLFLSLRPA